MPIIFHVVHEIFIMFIRNSWALEEGINWSPMPASELPDSSSAVATTALRLLAFAACAHQFPVHILIDHCHLIHSNCDLDAGPGRCYHVAGRLPVERGTCSCTSGCLHNRRWQGQLLRSAAASSTHCVILRTRGSIALH